ncbi:DUF3419 family protein [Myxococcota bacterium]|nr:DUF3419 family protein [Myxococcota bacterium]
MAGLDARWLRDLAKLPPHERKHRASTLLAPVLRRPMIAAYLRSPVQLVALGINFEQRDRLLHTEDTDMISFFIEHAGRVAATHIETNWFAWLFIAGHYNHERPDAVPPYLRKDRYERSFKAPTRVRFHNANLFDILARAEKQTWSHYTLCDAPDWLNPHLQRRLLDEIHRTSRDGGIVLVRSVEDQTMVEKLQDHKRFQLIKDRSAIASLEDRSRQYRRVHFYRIVH